MEEFPQDPAPIGAEIHAAFYTGSALGEPEPAALPAWCGRGWHYLRALLDPGRRFQRKG